MRTKHFILIFFATVVVLSSCVIREPEDKFELIRGGYDMFSLVQSDIVTQTNLFDKVLFLDSYMQAPDTLKEKFRKDYLAKYRLKFKHDTCTFLDSDNSVEYSIVRSSASIHTVGAEWSIKGGDYYKQYINIKCLEKNKWHLTQYFVDSMEYIYSNETDIVLTCTDTIAPLLYRNANFDVYGKGSVTRGYYAYSTLLKYEIESALKHNDKSLLFREGKIKVIASNSEDSRTAEAIAQYHYSEYPYVDLAFNKISYKLEPWDYYLGDYDN